MILNAFPSGGSSGFANFSYTGNVRVVTIGTNNYLMLLTSGTLTLFRNIRADVFVLGGGGAGGDNMPYGSVNGRSGGGGSGGFYVDEYGKILESGDYDIVIGAGADITHLSGATTFAESNSEDYIYTAAGGNSASGPTGGDGTGIGGTGSGGSGAIVENGTTIQVRTDGAPGIYPFGVAELGLYGGGGGGGGQGDSSVGANADDNTGKGGDGNDRGAMYHTAVGNGGSGIVILRIGG
jgi:hypothetical protein